MRALVDELVEAVLAVRAGLAPLDGTGGVRHARAVLRHALAVRLHVELLEIGGQAAEILVVRKHAVALGAVHVGVEDAEKRHHHGHVAREGRGAEVAVHLPVALEKALEVARTDGDHERKADGARKRVAAAHPVPEHEHVLRVDAELHHLGLVR